MYDAAVSVQQSERASSRRRVCMRVMNIMIYSTRARRGIENNTPAATLKKEIRNGGRAMGW